MAFKKIHLKRTSGAIQPGEDLESLCGRMIHKAQPVTLMADCADPLHHPLLCDKCRVRGVKENEMWGTYREYGMVDGEQSIRREAE